LVGKYRPAKWEIELGDRCKRSINCLPVSLGDRKVLAWVRALAKKNNVSVLASDLPDKEVSVEMLNGKRNGVVFLGRTGKLVRRLLELEEQRFTASVSGHK
jgi:hypothetical protein